MDKELQLIIDQILIKKASFINFNKIDYMKLLLCLECGDIFNLTSELKTCSCGKSKGMYINDLDAEITGNCQALGIDNSSFRESIKVQRLKDKQKPKKNECCKGVKFDAFFIPKYATSINKID